MIIEKIHINSFGNLQERTFEFSDGVNIIEGVNESGKSTIAAFIKFIFYGLSSKSRDKQLSERDRFINWDTGSAGGYMVIRSHDKKYRIERTVIIAGQSETRKSFREGCEIIDLSNNSPVTGVSSPGEHFLGVDEELFEKSAFVSQPGGTKIDGNKLLDSIENILFSASENINIAKAIKKLDTSRVALLHKNGGGGQIFELETKCAQLEAKLEKAKTIATDILKSEDSLRDAKENFKSSLIKKDKLSKEISAFENATIRTLFDKLHSLEAQASSVKEQINTLKSKYTVDSFYPDDTYVFELEKAINTLKDIKEALRRAEAELEYARKSFNNDLSSKSALTYEKIAGTIEQLNSTTSKKRTAKIMSAVFAAIAVIFASLGFVSVYIDYFSELGQILLFSALLPLALFVLFLCISISSKASVRRLFESLGVQSKDEFDTLLKEAEKANKEKAESENKIGEVENNYKLILESKGIAEKALENANFWKMADSAEENLAYAKLASDKMKESKDECDKLDQMYAMLKTQLEPYNEEEIVEATDASIDISDINASNISEKRRERDFCAKASEALETRIHELEKNLAALYPQSDNPARIAEKIELAQNFIAEYRKKHAAYLLAAEKIEEAGASMRESISPKLAEFTSKIMSELTGGKYSEIGINSELKVTVRTQNGVKELEYLSAGTQDIVYVSLRLALINTLFRTDTPSVVFDESFSRLDDTRLSQILKLLKLTGKNMQCILLTSNSREAMLMDVAANYSHIKLDSK